MGIAQGKKGSTHLLFHNLFNPFTLEAKALFIKDPCPGNGVDSYADMIYFL
jgi:hypothetical protein